MAREKRARLHAGKGVKKNGFYAHEDPDPTRRLRRAASFESLPPGPDPKTVAAHLGELLPRLTKKGTIFRASKETIEQRGQEFGALIEALLRDDEVVPRLLVELRQLREVRDFFGWWRRDHDRVMKEQQQHRPVSAGSDVGSAVGATTSRARSQSESVLSRASSLFGTSNNSQNTGFYFNASNLSIHIPASSSAPISTEHDQQQQQQQQQQRPRVRRPAFMAGGRGTMLPQTHPIPTLVPNSPSLIPSRTNSPSPSTPRQRAQTLQGALPIPVSAGIASGASMGMGMGMGTPPSPGSPGAHPPVSAPAGGSFHHPQRRRQQHHVAFAGIDRLGDDGYVSEDALSTTSDSVASAVTPQSPTFALALQGAADVKGKGRYRGGGEDVDAIRNGEDHDEATIPLSTGPIIVSLEEGESLLYSNLPVGNVHVHPIREHDYRHVHHYARTTPMVQSPLSRGLQELTIDEEDSEEKGSGEYYPDASEERVYTGSESQSTRDRDSLASVPASVVSVTASVSGSGSGSGDATDATEESGGEGEGEGAASGARTGGGRSMMSRIMSLSRRGVLFRPGSLAPTSSLHTSFSSISSSNSNSNSNSNSENEKTSTPTTATTTATTATTATVVNGVHAQASDSESRATNKTTRNRLRPLSPVASSSSTRSQTPVSPARIAAAHADALRALTGGPRRPRASTMGAIGKGGRGRPTDSISSVDSDSDAALFFASLGAAAGTGVGFAGFTGFGNESISEFGEVEVDREEDGHDLGLGLSKEENDGRASVLTTTSTINSVEAVDSTPASTKETRTSGSSGSAHSGSTTTTDSNSSNSLAPTPLFDTIDARSSIQSSILSCVDLEKRRISDDEGSSALYLHSPLLVADLEEEKEEKNGGVVYGDCGDLDDHDERHGRNDMDNMDVNTMAYFRNNCPVDTSSFQAPTRDSDVLVGSPPPRARPGRATLTRKRSSSVGAQISSSFSSRTSQFSIGGDSLLDAYFNFSNGNTIASPPAPPRAGMSRGLNRTASTASTVTMGIPESVRCSMMTIGSVMSAMSESECESAMMPTPTASVGIPFELGSGFGNDHDPVQVDTAQERPVDFFNDVDLDPGHDDLNFDEDNYMHHPEQADDSDPNTPTSPAGYASSLASFAPSESSTFTNSTTTTFSNTAANLLTVKAVCGEHIVALRVDRGAKASSSISSTPAPTPTPFSDVCTRLRAKFAGEGVSLAPRFALAYRPAMNARVQELRTGEKLKPRGGSSGGRARSSSVSSVTHNGSGMGAPLDPSALRIIFGQQDWEEAVRAVPQGSKLTLHVLNG